MAFETLKETCATAVRAARGWLFQHFSREAHPFTEFDFGWMDDRIGYPGIARSLLAKGVSRYDYMITAEHNAIGEDIDISMRYEIDCSEDRSRIALYHGNADSHTGTVLVLMQSGPERYRITDFYTCANGKTEENLPRHEDVVGEFLGETTFVLNQVNQKKQKERIRASLSVVTGGLSL